jgi:hypothetical protein
MFTEQEIIELIHGFICFAYYEMQNTGWNNNRINFRKKYKILDYEDHSYNINKEEEVTFPNMLLKNNGDLEKTLSEDFCREIRWRGWFDSYYFDITPIELDNINDVKLNGATFNYWYLTIILKDWIEKQVKNGTLVDELKSILGLDFCLK